MNKNKLFKYSYVSLIVIWIAFIFSNSLASPEESSNASGNATRIIQSILDYLSINIKVNEIFIRKCAHFLAFFILGALTFNTISLFGKSIRSSFIYVAYFGLLVAVTDESLQLISSRGSSLLDVLLDYSGYLTACLVFAVVLQLIRNKKQKKPDANE